MDMEMDAADSSSASTSSSSSPPASPTATTTTTTTLHRQLPPKRRAGRKKFRETRHPVFRGVRARAGGTRWVCEVREPQAQARIWLGTYPTPEMAARAHDVAAIALRGAAAHLLNFPDSAHTLPRARTAAPEDIRCAAAQAAELYRPSTSTSTSSCPQHAAGTPASAPTPTPAPTPLLSVSLPETTAAFLDEDAIFDMPGLIHDMARGMMLTPPPAFGLGRGGLADYWATADDDDDDDYHNNSHYMDYCTLWMD